ncbi:MAG: hypothetical protein ACXVHX_24965 [Solirubrobacteraceae bacterium]
MAENEIPQRGPAAAWDRVGKVLGDMASAAESVGNRNLTLWNTVSENIRHKKDYGADDVVNDTAKVMAAAMDNVEDIWSSLMRPPETELVARPIPTAFLYFAWADAGYSPAEPVRVVVPRRELEGLTDKPVIELDAPRGVKDSLRVRKEESKGYVVETAVGAADLGKLKAGTYSGAVYVAKGPRPRVLANLRVVVEARPE